MYHKLERVWLAWLVLGVVIAPACGGESTPHSPNQTESTPDASREDTLGGVGESCTRRADCSANLSCIANTCVTMATDAGEPMQTPLGERGETCTARNDCAQGLACVGSRCVSLSADPTVQMKQCFRVQCERSEDCCAAFTAPLNCPTWKMACSTGDMASCMSYNASCMCNQQCTNNMCSAFQRCGSDSECAGGVLRCLSGKCLQCGADSDCKQTGQKCISNVCRAPCERNEQCPLFSACKAGECVSVGCQSDRECYFASKKPETRCVDTQCVIGCSSDAECADFQACEGGRCKFVGCESDEECRIFLNLASQPGSDRAVCRLPDR